MAGFIEVYLMKFFRIASVFVAVVLSACSESNSDNQSTQSEDNEPVTTPTNSEASCESIDISIFCVSIDGAEKTLYVHTVDADSPLGANPSITGRFQTAGGITFTQVLFEITPTSFVKGATVVFGGITSGTYIMDGSSNFSVYTLAADQSWLFSPGFSSGSIEITKYGAIGDFITGIFSAVLCDSVNAFLNGSDCSDSNYLIDISGNFNILREADL